MKTFKEFLVEAEELSQDIAPPPYKSYNTRQTMVRSGDMKDMYKKLKHIAHSDDYELNKEDFKKLIKRFPTHFYDIAAKHRDFLTTEKGREMLMYADPEIQEAIKLIENPLDLRKLPFIRNPDWLNQDRANVVKLKEIYSQLTPKQLKRFMNSTKMIERRYYNLANDELLARKNEGLPLK
jgi:hypothetical protein